MIEINKDIKDLLFLGPQGSYCETAKNLFLSLLSDKKPEQKPFATIKKMIYTVNDNPLAAAVIPIENSLLSAPHLQHLIQ